MSKRVKLKDDNYLDSTSIVHENESLDKVLDNNIIYSTDEQKIGKWVNGKNLVPHN